MAADENTNIERDKENMILLNKEKPYAYIKRRTNQANMNMKNEVCERRSTTEYCSELQGWMWQYYSGAVGWQSWVSVCAAMPHYHPLLHPGTTTPHNEFTGFDAQNWYNNPFGLPLSTYSPGLPSPAVPTGLQAQGSSSLPAATLTQQQTPDQRNALRPGREYIIPSPFQRLVAEMVDFFILFFIKATIIISIMHLSGMKDISKFAMHFIVEEIDEDTSMEELQKMMLVALVYRVLVCFYEIACLWGAGGATPGKLLLGLQVVMCDSSVLVQPRRVLVVPATEVSLSASTIRALNKNFSIAFFFPAFITLLFFQHNRTVYDMVAGTIVVKRTGAR
ncbi:protein FAM8A1-like [Gadus chalcogrammus]|uniref:protein FAM8A1-like n=1 Tax=Gadus chalcogrammus TaxID=1042646 RepID=UPI0024C4CF24|nr:protein FAM8A1-like [Gadus chalcogrammus]